MRVNKKPVQIKMLSLSDNYDIILNKSQSISLHKVDKQYQILSINKFEKVNNVGYFNKKTDFRIGEKNSIMVLDKNLEIYHPDTSQIKSSDYIIYPLPYKYLNQNESFLFKSYSSGELIEIKLTFEFGEYLIKQLIYMSKYNKLFEESTYNYPKELYNLLIYCNEFGYSFNKNFLINSNTNFLLGILNGLNTNLFSNINIYTFTSILNYLGAMYSITKGPNNTRKLNYYLPEEFKYLITNKKIKFKKDSIHKKNILKNIDSKFLKDKMETKLWEKIENNEVLLIKVEDLEFNIIENREDMYDYSMARADATNYTIPFGPILKNSDGDILGIIGIFGKESLEEAKEFSPLTKDYYRNFNDGEVQNWISKDSVLGLYNITKQLKNK